MPPFRTYWRLWPVDQEWGRLTTNYIHIYIHNEPVILEIGPRGPVSYQRDFPRLQDSKKKMKRRKKASASADGDARRGSGRLDSRDRGEKVRLMKSIGPQRGFKSLVPTI